MGRLGPKFQTRSYTPRVVYGFGTRHTCYSHFMSIHDPILFLIHREFGSDPFTAAEVLAVAPPEYLPDIVRGAADPAKSLGRVLMSLSHRPPFGYQLVSAGRRHGAHRWELWISGGFTPVDPLTTPRCPNCGHELPSRH
jgi:hypothetical protein